MNNSQLGKIEYTYKNRGTKVYILKSTVAALAVPDAM